MTPAAFQYVQPELYDAIYAWYDADVAYYLEAARSAGGPVLEVGCGTGRLLLPALEAGADVDGLDLDPGMLEVLRRKAAARGLAPHVVEADMRDFTMPRRYALVTIPFRAFMHLTTTDDQIRALRCIREHLLAGGALRFNVFHVNFESIVDPGHVVNREMKGTHPESGLPLRVRLRRRDVDRVNQVMEIEREVVELDVTGADGRCWRHGFSLRWTGKAEMELLLRAAGFQRFEVRGGFDGEPLERDDQEMVWTAWKDGA